MPIQIEVQDAHAQLLIDFYVSRLRILRDEIMEREKESKDINAVIQKLKQKNNDSNSKAARLLPVVHYSDKWPWVKKVQFAIEYGERPLTTKEIVDTLTEFEPSFLFDRKRAVASISSILSSKSGRDKEFIRTDSETGEFAYDINRTSEMPSENDESEFEEVPF